MKVITVDSLDGIPSQHQADLYGVMRTCSNGQRLAVCLYLMSDLPDARHHLAISSASTSRFSHLPCGTTLARRTTRISKLLLFAFCSIAKRRMSRRGCLRTGSAFGHLRIAAIGATPIREISWRGKSCATTTVWSKKEKQSSIPSMKNFRRSSVHTWRKSLRKKPE